MKSLIVGRTAVILPLTACADEVFLKSGGQLSGRIVSRSATTIEENVETNPPLDDSRFSAPR